MSADGPVVAPRVQSTGCGTRYEELTADGQVHVDYAPPLGEPFFEGDDARPSVDTELVALDVQHRDARIVAVVQRLHVYCAKRDQPCAFGLKRGEALSTYESGADPHIKMHPVLGGLPLGDALEVQPWAHT